MAKKYGCYAEDMVAAAKEMLIEEIKKDLQEFDPQTDNAYGTIVGIAGKVIMTERFTKELLTEKDDDR